MKKIELAHTLAIRQGVPSGVAADDLDRTVNRLIQALRHGKPARLPGIGTIEPGSQWVLRSTKGGDAK